MITFRLWPLRIWFAAVCYPIWRQGGFYYANGKITGARHVNKGFMLRCGFTWQKQSTYRERPMPLYSASYLITEDE